MRLEQLGLPMLPRIFVTRTNRVALFGRASSLHDKVAASTYAVPLITVRRRLHNANKPL